jgi:hypothetical protein
VKLRVGLLIVLLGVGCRPSSDAAEPELPSDERSPPIAWMAQPGGKTDPVYVAPSRPPREREQTAAIEGSPCELACADVYACVLEDGHSPSAASSIELGCLDGCVRAPDAFATCERPDSIGAEVCAGYLECVRANWPSGEGAPAPGIDPSAVNGCDLACAAFARCYDATRDQADECGRKCREALTEELQRVAGECAQLDGCTAIESCVERLPGA